MSNFVVFTFTRVWFQIWIQQSVRKKIPISIYRVLNCLNSQNISKDLSISPNRPKNFNSLAHKYASQWFTISMDLPPMIICYAINITITVQFNIAYRLTIAEYWIFFSKKYLCSFRSILMSPFLWISSFNIKIKKKKKSINTCRNHMRSDEAEEAKGRKNNVEAPQGAKHDIELGSKNRPPNIIHSHQWHVSHKTRIIF